MKHETTATQFLKTAAETAEHFGFATTEDLKQELTGVEGAVALPYSGSAKIRKQDNLNGLLTAGLEAYCKGKMHREGEPVLQYRLTHVPRSNEPVLALDIFNVPKSIAEIILIQTTRAFLRDLGYQRPTVRLNSLGDSESATRYHRELTNYLRKRIDTMPPEARELMKEHAMLALMSLMQSGDELADRAPSAMEYLSDQSRKHFREIIEYLDMSETPYEIDQKMLGHHECYSDALFSIVADDTETEPRVSLSGGRYDEHVRRNTNSNIPAAGAVITLNQKTSPKRIPRYHRPESIVYIAQLGFGPKMRSLMVIDLLRQAGLRVNQDITHDSLSTQLQRAETFGVKYVVIIGQKEYVEDTVILRNMQARTQENISIQELIKKMKRQKKNVHA